MLNIVWWRNILPEKFYGQIQANILNLLPIASSASEVIEGVVYTANIITGIPVEGEPTPYNIIVTYPNFP